jgi:hypothetical protein
LKQKFLTFFQHVPSYSIPQHHRSDEVLVDLVLSGAVAPLLSPMPDPSLLERETVGPTVAALLGLTAESTDAYV